MNYLFTITADTEWSGAEKIRVTPRFVLNDLAAEQLATKIGLPWPPTGTETTDLGAIAISYEEL